MRLMEKEVNIVILRKMNKNCVFYRKPMRLALFRESECVLARRICLRFLSPANNSSQEITEAGLSHLCHCLKELADLREVSLHFAG